MQYFELKYFPKVIGILGKLEVYVTNNIPHLAVILTENPRGTACVLFLCEIPSLICISFTILNVHVNRYPYFEYDGLLVVKHLIVTMANQPDLWHC